MTGDQHFKNKLIHGRGMRETGTLNVHTWETYQEKEDLAK